MRDKKIYTIKVEKITSISTIRSTNSLGKYLGFPMFQGRVKKEDFGFIIDKLQNRLASWKNKLLNKAGRSTLVKSVLNDIPSCYMQINWLPASVCTLIDRIAKHFLWQGTSRHGVHLIGWDKVTRSKKDGGLSLRAARASNTVLLGKLVWDMQQHPNKAWVSMLYSKYVKHGDFLDSPHKYGSPIWNAITKVRGVLKEGYQYRVGNGQSLFWYSPWTPFGPLCHHVFAMDIQDTALKISYIYINDQWQWNIMSTSIPQYIKDYINSFHPFLHANVSDGYIWSSNLAGVYPAKDGYRWLM